MATSDPNIIASLVQDIAKQLSAASGVSIENGAAAAAFVLCYRRYSTPSFMFELVRKGLVTTNPSLGFWRLLFIWIRLRFRMDFYVTNQRKRRLFHATIELLYQRRTMRAKDEDIFEINRILLLMLRHGHLHLRKWPSSQPGPGKRPLKLSMIPENPSLERTFWEYTPREVAEQMTLIEANMFRAIRPEEFYRKGWTDPVNAPVLHMLVSRSNSISSWVASNILCQSTTASRSRALARFVLIAHALEEIGNYNSMVSIVGGFQLWAITRLQCIIPLNPGYRKILGHIEGLLNPDGNYRCYRAIQTIRHGRPFLPYLGLYLKDLTFIEDGNLDVVNNKPNTDKIGLFGNVLSEIERYQRGCLEFNRRIETRLPRLLEHLARFPRMSESEMEHISLSLRPCKVMDSSSSSTDSGKSTRYSDLDTTSGSSALENSGSEGSEMQEQAAGGDSAISTVLRFLPPSITPRRAAIDSLQPPRALAS
jgi:hypothetical protein